MFNLVNNKPHGIQCLFHKHTDWQLCSSNFRLQTNHLNKFHACSSWARFCPQLSSWGAPEFTWAPTLGTDKVQLTNSLRVNYKSLQILHRAHCVAQGEKQRGHHSLPQWPRECLCGYSEVLQQTAHQQSPYTAVCSSGSPWLMSSLSLPSQRIMTQDLAVNLLFLSPENFVSSKEWVLKNLTVVLLSQFWIVSKATVMEASTARSFRNNCLNQLAGLTRDTLLPHLKTF